MRFGIICSRSSRCRSRSWRDTRLPLLLLLLLRRRRRQRRRLPKTEVRRQESRNRQLVKVARRWPQRRYPRRNRSCSSASCSPSRSRSSSILRSRYGGTYLPPSLSIQPSHVLIDDGVRASSALESGDYLAASDLFLTTERIHSRLLYDSRSSSLLASIPLLSRQWAIVNQFPRKIKNSTRASLVHTNCSSVEYARALYALILLDDITVEAALVQLLDARRVRRVRVISLSLSLSLTLTHFVSRISTYKTNGARV